MQANSQLQKFWSKDGKNESPVSLSARFLVILDLAMPVMNGLEAAVVLKWITPEIPIILFTNHAAAFRCEIAKAPINVVGFKE
jgi:CheY-like chemotaxis protein